MAYNMKCVLGLFVLTVVAVAVYSESCRNIWSCSQSYAHMSCTDNYHKACVNHTCTCSPPANSTHFIRCTDHSGCPDKGCPNRLSNYCFDDGKHGGQKTCHCAL